MAERTSYRVVKPEAILHCRETAVASFPKLQYSSMNVVNSLLRVTQVRTSKGEGEGGSSEQFDWRFYRCAFVECARSPGRPHFSIHGRKEFAVVFERNVLLRMWLVG
jgi:hypothetical protein